MNFFMVDVRPMARPAACEAALSFRAAFCAPFVADAAAALDMATPMRRIVGVDQI